MHGYPDWFMWAIMAIYAGAYVLPAAVALAVVWWWVKRRRK